MIPLITGIANAKDFKQEGILPTDISVTSLRKILKKDELEAHYPAIYDKYKTVIEKAVEDAKHHSEWIKDNFDAEFPQYITTVARSVRSLFSVAQAIKEEDRSQ